MASRSDVRPRAHRVSAAMRTSVGVVRERNEDCAHVDPAGRFFIVADGMGGRKGGDIASATAVQVVREILARARGRLDLVAAAPSVGGRAWVCALLDSAARAANQAVYERGLNEPARRGMGTTLDVVVVLGGEAFVAHVGDSRTYHIRGGAARTATSDHTVAQVMRRAGTLSADEAERSPMRSVLCNAIGSTPQLEVDQLQLQLEPGDRLLICTDGLYDYFTDDELARYLTCEPGEAALDRMVADACARGGEDNITGVVVEVADDAAPADELDDAPTTPISVPVESTPASPLAGVPDAALGAIVEQALRETSQRHRVPVPPAES